MAEVVKGIDAKLKHRHPHVWGEAAVSGVEEVLERWECLKREEKEERYSLLDGVPLALPALLRAHLYGKRAARVGFDWADAAGVLEKVREEMGELGTAQTPEEVEAEMGDLLFAVANWARHQGVEPEAALRRANERFARRFRALEDLARKRDLDLVQMGLDEMEALWREVKGHIPFS
jgi:MazG family protein